MTDRITKEKRSWTMSRIRSKNTKPELIVRSLLHRLGFRFRLHKIDLPGKPDIALPKYKTVILVHGCFWHRHKKCKFSSMPSSNIQYWKRKFARNVKRDKQNQELLEKHGWTVLVIWECETNNLQILEDKIMGALCKNS